MVWFYLIGKKTKIPLQVRRGYLFYKIRLAFPPFLKTIPHDNILTMFLFYSVFYPEVWFILAVFSSFWEF